MKCKSDHANFSQVVVQRCCDFKNDLVLTRHNGGVLPTECPACYIQLEKQLLELLALSKAAVDSVLKVEDFEGAQHYIGARRALLSEVDGQLSQLEATETEPAADNS